MNGWMIGAIALASFGLAWAVDVLLGTGALVVFSVLMLVGPVAALEAVRQVRKRLDGAPS